MAAMGNIVEGKHLHDLIFTKNIREQARRLICLFPQQRGAGVIKLTIEESIHMPQGLQVKIREVNQKLELETYQ